MEKGMKRELTKLKTKFGSLQGNKDHLDWVQCLFTTKSSTFVIRLVSNFNLLPDNICF